MIQPTNGICKWEEIWMNGSETMKERLEKKFKGYAQRKGIMQIKFQSNEPIGKKVHQLNISHTPAFFNKSKEIEAANLYCLSNYEKSDYGEFWELMDFRNEKNEEVNTKIIQGLLQNYDSFLLRLDRKPWQSLNARKIKKLKGVSKFKPLKGENYSCQIKGEKMAEQVWMHLGNLANCAILFRKQSTLRKALEQGKIIEWLEERKISPLVFQKTGYNQKAFNALLKECQAIMFFPHDFEGEMIAVLSNHKMKKEILSSIKKNKGKFPLITSTKKKDVVYFLSPAEKRKVKLYLKKIKKSKRQSESVGLKDILGERR